MRTTIPDFALVMLIGPSGSGKTTFARKHFKPTEILSSDFYRGVVGDDDRSATTTDDAFATMQAIAATRLKRRRLTVIDATNLHRNDRAKFTTIARDHHAQTVAVVFDVGERTCRRHNAEREEPRPEHVIRRHARSLRQTVKNLAREGYRRRVKLTTPVEVTGTEVVRERLACDRRDVTGRIDVIGDVHGCRAELEALLTELGYQPSARDRRRRFIPPDDTTAVFVGDLVDRGPDPAGVLTIVMNMVTAGDALAVRGNHDDKLARLLAGRNVKIADGLEETKAKLDSEDDEFGTRTREFLNGMASHYVLDEGKLVVTHAAIREDLMNRASGEVREFCLYGETNDEKTEDGFKVRTYGWVKDYRPGPRIVYGHDPVAEPKWENSTLRIDTGCAFGGKLSALRYPGGEIVSVPAKETYATPRTPLGERRDAADAAGGDPGLLDVADLIGPAEENKRLFIETGLLERPVTIPAEHAGAAFDVLTRSGVDPRWLIHLPPTMAPCEAAPDGDLLERPAEAFGFYREKGVTKLVCQEKHMGSRAIVVVTRDDADAAARFGFREEDAHGGRIYTRTGRPFFDDRETEAEVLGTFRGAMNAAGFWRRHETGWACFDCEIMPWSAKGEKLIEHRYTRAATAGELGLSAAVEALTTAAKRDGAHGDLLADYRARLEMTRAYELAYRRYNWPVRSVRDLRIAPFHLLATEGAVHAATKPHAWHMAEIDALIDRDDDVLFRTDEQHVDMDAADGAEAVERATRWWTERTAAGGEGMVVKPAGFVAHTTRGGKREPVTPAIKCRGREYLRIIYGPEYTTARNLARLRKRSVRSKAWRALREFALGIHGLTQFVERRPLRNVHQAALGVLALETEPADPRL